jgi:hypothetical protein
MHGLWNAYSERNMLSAVASQRSARPPQQAETRMRKRGECAWRRRTGFCTRLMVPGSYKGRGGNGGSDPVPVGDDVIEVLLPAIAGRPSHAPLFERWIHEQEPGGIAWKKSERGPWKRAELARPWKAIREHAGMPDAIPYALRHSSIVRGLRKGLPIQQVAKLHNTSVKMIERHYAKYIATALEDLARAAVVSLVPRSDGNVGPMGKRA